MNISFSVDNVMCGGCSSNIEKTLKENAAITEVKVDVETGKVDITANEDVTEWAKTTLVGIGFPEKQAEALDPMAAFKAGALGK